MGDVESGMPTNRPKQILFSAVLLLIILIFLELVSMAAFRIFGDRFTFYSPDRYVLSEEDSERLTPWFDKGLGWSFHYKTPYTERKREKEYGRPLISSFGDSYTHCTDVEDDESWQHYISEILEADAYNFGTGGYGTDQAYLKYLEVAPRLKTDIVVIGLTPENINRIVNVYRPFYFSRTGIKMPKPRFVLEGGYLRLIENPLRGPDEMGKLTDPDFVLSLGRNDWWFNRDEYPVLGFPYLKILLNKRVWLEAVHGKMKGTEVDDTQPRPWVNLWEDEAASSLMYAILDSFIGEIRSRGSVPVVMISAMKPDVFHKFMTGKDPLPVELIKEYCAVKDCACFDAVEVIASRVSRMEEIPALYRVHVGPEGNRMIAEGFAGFLRSDRLIGEQEVD
jgi:hypothetical protein